MDTYIFDKKLIMTKGNYLIVDLEATCDNTDQFDRNEMETIEIGSVVCNEQWVVIGKTSIYVRPVRHPRLTPFCTQLTGIDQATVDAASTFPEAIKEFQLWLKAFDPVAQWFSWGKYDWYQLTKDSEYHQCAFPLSTPYCNLKAEYAKAHRCKRVSMKTACQQLGIELIGRHHSGADDAHNMARIIQASAALQARIKSG